MGVCVDEQGLSVEVRMTIGAGRDLGVVCGSPISADCLLLEHIDSFLV